jgi:hypothetical protein
MKEYFRQNPRNPSLSPMHPELPNLMDADALPPRKRIAFSTFIRKMLKQSILSILSILSQLSLPQTKPLSSARSFCIAFLKGFCYSLNPIAPKVQVALI